MASYNTIQKQIIIKFLEEHKDRHLNIDEMLELLKKEDVSVSRATLYRTIDSLVESGVVRKYVINENEKACFQYIDSDDCHHHFHLLCSKCGKLIHLECEKFEEILEHFSSEHGFKVYPGRVVLYGICSECQEKGGANNA